MGVARWIWKKAADEAQGEMASELELCVYTFLCVCVSVSAPFFFKGCFFLLQTNNRLLHERLPAPLLCGRFQCSKRSQTRQDFVVVVSVVVGGGGCRYELAALTFLYGADCLDVLGVWTATRSDRIGLLFDASLDQCGLDPCCCLRGDGWAVTVGLIDTISAYQAYLTLVAAAVVLGQG